MKLLSLQSAGLQNGAAVFGVSIEADNGTRYTFWADGRALDRPAAFAAHATDRTGAPCTSPYVGDEGGWQAHLGDMLRRTAGAAQPTSNATPGAPAAAAAGEDRRTAMLAATSLGQATLSAQTAATFAAAEKAVAAPVPVESFPEQCRREAAEAAAAATASRAKFHKLTHLGRETLAPDNRK